jgi:hypothetical protein
MVSLLVQLVPRQHLPNPSIDPSLREQRDAQIIAARNESTAIDERIAPPRVGSGSSPEVHGVPQSEFDAHPRQQGDIPLLVSTRPLCPGCRPRRYGPPPRLPVDNNGLQVNEILRLLAEIGAASADLPSEDSASLTAVVQVLQDEVQEAEPDRAMLSKLGSKLSTLAGTVGTAALVAAVEKLVPMLIG